MKYSFAVAVLVNQVTARDWMCVKDHRYYLEQKRCAWACEGDWLKQNDYNCQHGLSQWTCENPHMADLP